MNKKKTSLPSFLIALTILCKAYTLILLPFLIFRKKIKLTFAIFGWLIVLLSIVVLYFGFSETLTYHKMWWEKDVLSKHIYGYGNQSLWSFITGLICDVERIEGLKYNILKLDLESSKKVALIVLGIISSIIGLVFIKTYKYPKAFSWQYVIVLATIPVFSPLAWKHYYVFLTPLIIILVHQAKKTSSLNWVIFSALLLLNFTSPLLIGHRYSDIFETIGVFPLSSLVVIFSSILLFHKNQEKLFL